MKPKWYVLTIAVVPAASFGVRRPAISRDTSGNLLGRRGEKQRAARPFHAALK